MPKLVDIFFVTYNFGKTEESYAPYEFTSFSLCVCDLLPGLLSSGLILADAHTNSKSSSFAYFEVGKFSLTSAR
jgi:hypothetical protein